MAKFTKSVWFKCISVLLVISVISGGLLAIFNDVLYVSPKERTERAIAKIYGQTVDISEDNIILDVDGDTETKKTPIEYDFGKINKIYKINNDVLFQATGYKGYKNGSVTLWIKVLCENEKYSISTVIMESYEKQTLMSKFGAEYYAGFKLTDVTESYNNGDFFTVDSGVNSIPNTGATFTATAHSNAVNCVLTFIGEGGLENEN